MSALVFLHRILIPKQVYARTITLGKFLRDNKINQRSDESLGPDEVYDYDPIDRSEVIDVETSIRYIESTAFNNTYGDKPVWVLYRRNQNRHKFRDTRESCIRANKISTATPCPICRDKYLIPDYTNIKLLKHFISPHHGGLLPTKLTGVCQRQQKKLKIAFLKAKEYGTITFDVPFRHYNYKYYEELIERHTCKE